MTDKPANPPDPPADAEPDPADERDIDRVLAQAANLTNELEEQVGPADAPADDPTCDPLAAGPTDADVDLQLEELEDMLAEVAGEQDLHTEEQAAEEGSAPTGEQPAPDRAPLSPDETSASADSDPKSPATADGAPTDRPTTGDSAAKPEVSTAISTVDQPPGNEPDVARSSETGSPDFDESVIPGVDDDAIPDLDDGSKPKPPKVKPKLPTRRPTTGDSRSVGRPGGDDASECSPATAPHTVDPDAPLWTRIGVRGSNLRAAVLPRCRAALLGAVDQVLDAFDAIDRAFPWINYDVRRLIGWIALAVFVAACAIAAFSLS